MIDAKRQFLAFLPLSLLLWYFLTLHPLYLSPLIESAIVAFWSLVVCSMLTAILWRTFSQNTACVWPTNRLLLCLMVASAVFALRWGRYSFISSYHHDEFGYFAAVSGQPVLNVVKSVFEPLNEHFKPVYRALMTLLIEVFGGNYFGFAAAGYGSALSVVILLGFTCMAASGSWIAVSLLLVFISCHQIIWETLSWQAGTIPVTLPMALFLFASLRVDLYLHEAPNKKEEFKRFLWAGIAIALTVFSSSLITIPVVYLAAAVVLGATRGVTISFWRKLIFILLTAFAISLFYFYVRGKIVSAPAPAVNIENIFDNFPIYIGQCLTVHVLPIPSFTHHWNLGLIFSTVSFSLSLIWLLLLVRRTSEGRAASNLRLYLFIVGMLIFQLGLLQVFVGRGNHIPLQSRHAFFPLLGLYLSLFAIIYESATRIGLHRAKFGKLFAGGLLGCSIVVAMAKISTDWKSEELKDRAQFITQRNKFLTDLNQLICLEREKAAPGIVTILPDLAPPKALRMYFPFNATDRGFGLEFVTRMNQLPCHNVHLVKFVPSHFIGDMQTLVSHACQERESLKCRFFRRYYHDDYRRYVAGVKTALPPSSKESH